MTCTTCPNTPDGNSAVDKLEHPCYSPGAAHRFARMHLPVAPACNISCNYCNRKFDCVNESRPGVTSEVLDPTGALEKFKIVREKIPNLRVIGIAGPGDALANWAKTRESFELIKAAAPEMLFCLSTNGLLLPYYADEIVKLGIKHVTVTMNCLDPEIGAKIYKYVDYKGEKLTGPSAARILIDNQLNGIRALTRQGVLVKVNIVMIKGINDHHIPVVVKKAKELGAFISNIMPLIPADGSVFVNYPQTSRKELNDMRQLCQIDLQQMYHCQQCRADAVGLLQHDRSAEFRSETCQAANRCQANTIPAKKYRIAVVSKYGRLVDQHFGYAHEFDVYEFDGKNFKLLEKRKIPKYCTGVEECDSVEEQRESTIGALHDCQAVLCLRIGYHAKERLRQQGIIAVEYCDSIENGLEYAVAAIQRQNIA